MVVRPLWRVPGNIHDFILNPNGQDWLLFKHQIKSTVFALVTSLLSRAAGGILPQILMNYSGAHVDVGLGAFSRQQQLFFFKFATCSGVVIPTQRLTGKEGFGTFST